MIRRRRRRRRRRKITLEQATKAQKESTGIGLLLL